MRKLGYAYAIVGDVAEITSILLRRLGSIAAPFSEGEKGPYSALLPCAGQSTQVYRSSSFVWQCCYELLGV